MNNENVGSIQYSAVIDTKGLKASADEADKIASKTGSNIASNMKKAAVGLGVIGAGLTLYAKNATDFTVDLYKSSKQLGQQIGVSTTEASRLTAAFSKMGIETESAQQMFGIFSKNIVKSTEDIKNNKFAHDKLVVGIEKTKFSIAETSAEIRKHGDKSGELTLKLKELNQTLANQKNSLNQSQDAFQKLGISTVNAKGKQKDFNTLLFEVADKFKELPNGVDKTALSMQLFGRSGKDIIKVLDLGSAGIQNLEKEADKLGLTLTTSTIGKINDFVQSQKNLKQQTDALKLSIGIATAPVLTAFNTKLNDVISAALNTTGVLHGVVTSVLAFGGPVTTATAGLLGFTANLTQIISSGGGVRGSLGLLAGFLTGPWGAAIGAAGLIVASLTLGFYGQKSALDQLRTAQDLTKISQDNLASADFNAQQAKLTLEGATLRVKDAQKAHTDAVAKYGPKSEEARRANNDLKQAILDKKKAEHDATKAVQDMQAAEQKYAKDKSFELALASKADKVSGLQGAVNELNKSIADTPKPSGTPAQKAGGGASVVDRLRRAFGGFRAAGGPVSASKAYWVGDNPDGSLNKTSELFVPKTSGTIIPSEDLATMGNSRQAQNIEIHNHFDGVMVSSKADLRIVGERIISSVDEARKAKGLKPINGGMTG